MCQVLGWTMEVQQCPREDRPCSQSFQRQEIMQSAELCRDVHLAAELSQSVLDACAMKDHLVQPFI